MRSAWVGLGFFGVWVYLHAFTASKHNTSPSVGRVTSAHSVRAAAATAAFMASKHNTSLSVGRMSSAHSVRGGRAAGLSKTPVSVWGGRAAGFSKTVSASALRELEWCKRNRHRTLVFTPSKGFGNRMRALVAAHYIALLTGRELVVLWPEFAEFVQPNTSRCVRWETRRDTQACRTMNCTADVETCVTQFSTRSIRHLFPDSERCVHLISYTAWDLYLLDNAVNHGSVMSVTQNIPAAAILGSVTQTMTLEIWHMYDTYRARMALSTAAHRHVMMTLHIRTGADREDGGVVKHLFMPQLRCARVLQEHFSSLNFTSSVFVESDSAYVKTVAAAMPIHNLVVLETHAERADLKYTIVLWLLLGEGDIFLGAHTSSLSRTAAQRTGTVLYQLPNHHAFRASTSAGEHTVQCVRDGVRSTKTHDAVFIMTPSECANVFPGCPEMSVNMIV